MKLSKYFRQLKRFSVSRNEFEVRGLIKLYYSYNNKIFLNYLLFGLFKDNIQLTFRRSLPKYIHDLVEYKIRMFSFKKSGDNGYGFIEPYAPEFQKNLFVNQFVLEDVAKANGFKISEKKLFSTKSVYTLSPSND